MTAPVLAASESPWAPVATLAEKAFWTAAEAFLAAVLMFNALDTNTLTKAGIAGLAALITVLANGVAQVAVPGGLPPLVDLSLRVVRTFAAAFLAPLVVPLTGGHIPDMDGFRAALFAGTVAAIALVKGAIVSLKTKGTPATLPVRLDLAAA